MDDPLLMGIAKGIGVAALSVVVLLALSLAAGLAVLASWQQVALHQGAEREAKKEKVIAEGTVIPPHLVRPVSALPDGKAKVVIERVMPENGYDAEGKPRPSERLMALCRYPDGFTKDHQVKTVADLLPQVPNQLRNRYGLDSVWVESLPEKLEVGAVLTFTVKNRK